MKIILLSLAFLNLSGCLSDTYEFFPLCNETAPYHHVEIVKANRDAAIVGDAASRDGWGNVRVYAPTFEYAKVEGYCYKSKEVQND